MAKPVKAKEQIRLSTGDMMTLGEALDRGLVTLGTTEERAARPRGERLTVRSYYAKDPRTQELWPVSRALFESRTAGTFKPGAPAPTKITSKAREHVAAAGTGTPFMVLADGDVVGYYADLPSAITAADHWQEEHDRGVKIFEGDRAMSKGEIETARSHVAAGHAHARRTKKSPAQLDREIAEVLATPSRAHSTIKSSPAIDTTETLERKFKVHQRDALTLAEKARQARGAATRWMKRSSSLARAGEFRAADDAQTEATALGRMARDLEAEVSLLRTRLHATKKTPSPESSYLGGLRYKTESYGPGGTRSTGEALLTNRDGTRNDLGRLLARIAKAGSPGLATQKTSDVMKLVDLGYTRYGLHPNGGYRANVTEAGLSLLGRI